LGVFLFLVYSLDERWHATKNTDHKLRGFVPGQLPVYSAQPKKILGCFLLGQVLSPVGG
jgi:hypothetical protein